MLTTLEMARAEFSFYAAHIARTTVRLNPYMDTLSTSRCGCPANPITVE